jgi:hypothetical protein
LLGALPEGGGAAGNQLAGEAEISSSGRLLAALEAKGRRPVGGVARLISLMVFGGVAAREPLGLVGARLLLGRHVVLFAVAAICGPLIAMALSRFPRSVAVSAEQVLLETRRS